MPTGLIVFLAIALPVLGFILWVALQDAFVKIGAGEIGLVITRGKPAKEGIPPGTHFALRFGRVIEVYPAVELTYLTGEAEPVDTFLGHTLAYTAPPLRAVLGDRATVTVHYTLRFAVTSAGLATINTRFGESGIRGIIRDESRRVIIETLNDSGTSIANAHGPGLAALETAISERLKERLAACGFDVTMFNLREVELGGTGEVIQATVRAAEELELELATAAVRLARARNEAKVDAEVAATLSDEVLRYRQIEVWRELIQRWDGKTMLLSDLLKPGGVVPAEQPAPEAKPAEGEQA